MFNRLQKVPSTKQQVATILWLSFLMAGAATGVFFSLVDPIEVGACISMPEVSRTGAYSIGFFLFWLLTAGTSLFTQLFLGVEQSNQI